MFRLVGSQGEVRGVANFYLVGNGPCGGMAIGFRKHVLGVPRVCRVDYIADVPEAYGRYFRFAGVSLLVDAATGSFKPHKHRNALISPLGGL